VSRATPGPAAGRATRVARETAPLRLTDAGSMRALAHPVRVALLEALTREGPLTATEASDLLGESPANCSFHLRTLAKYGFVEEVEGGTGRARPWRRVALGNSFSEIQSDPEASAAAQALAEVSHQRTFQRVSNFTHHPEQFAPAWTEAAFSSDMLVYLTPAELEKLGADVLALIGAYVERTLDTAKRPTGSGPVQLAVFGTPLPPMPSGG
jgi:predicted transcriptional regulator